MYGRHCLQEEDFDRCSSLQFLPGMMRTSHSLPLPPSPFPPSLPPTPSLPLPSCRPVAGYLNFCPGRVSTDHAHFDQQLSIVLHELLHILVGRCGWVCDVLICMLVVVAFHRHLKTIVDGRCCYCLNCSDSRCFLMHSSLTTMTRTAFLKPRGQRVGSPLTALGEEGGRRREEEGRRGEEEGRGRSRGREGREAYIYG